MNFKLPKLEISKSEWVSFILTLIATLVGVLIAIWLTNVGINDKEKKDTIKLLNTSKLILENTRQYTSALNNTILNLQNKETKELTKSLNPIPYPDLLETILSNELISKNMSEYSHNHIYEGIINLRKLARYESVELYLKNLEDLILLLNLEIEYQKGEINSQEFESKFEIGKEIIVN